MRKTLLLLFFVGALAAAGAAPPSAYAQERSAEPAVDLPASFVLSAAYPNPFNPRTSFSLTVQERQEVRVEIFNLLGQPVRLLFEGMMEAGETQTFVFEADDLPSGLYLYRVRGKDFTSTRQVTLLK